MKLLKYRIVIEPDTGGAYHGYAPALRGCHTWGDSVEETKEHLKEAISLHVESLRILGQPIPEEETDVQPLGSIFQSVLLSEPL